MLVAKANTRSAMTRFKRAIIDIVEFVFTLICGFVLFLFGICCVVVIIAGILLLLSVFIPLFLMLCVFLLFGIQFFVAVGIKYCIMWLSSNPCAQVIILRALCHGSPDQIENIVVWEVFIWEHIAIVIALLSVCALCCSKPLFAYLRKRIDEPNLNRKDGTFQDDNKTIVEPDIENAILEPYEEIKN